MLIPTFRPRIYGPPEGRHGRIRARRRIVSAAKTRRPRMSMRLQTQLRCVRIVGADHQGEHRPEATPLYAARRVPTSFLVVHVGVAAVPGDNFYARGSDGSRYLRFAFCCSRKAVAGGGAPPPAAEGATRGGRRRHVRHSNPTMKARPGMLLPTPPFDSAVLAKSGSRLIAMNNGWSFLFNRLRTAPVSHSPPPSS